MSGATSDSEEVAAFSLDWMFERCNRRFEHALLAGDNDKAQAYNQRRALLADFRNFAGAADEDVREQATDMLNTMENLSSCEGSPTRDLYESDYEKATRIEYGRIAMHALQGSMAMQLQGCGMSDGSGGSWFHFAFLSAWTLPLAIYSWYMLRNMNMYAYVPPPRMNQRWNTMKRALKEMIQEGKGDRKHRLNHEVSAVGRAAGILLVPLAKCLEHGQGEDHHRTLR